MKRKSLMRPTNDYTLDFTPHFSLDRQKTALVVVDMQYASACQTTGMGRLLAERGQAELGCYRYDRIERLVVPTIQRLLEFFRRESLRVLYLTIGSEVPDYSDLHPHMRMFAEAVGNTKGNIEHEILAELKPAPGELVINKTTMGAFNSTPLDVVLRAMGVTDLVFVGVSTDLCVETTARDAADRGFHCVMVDDGCATGSQELHDASLRVFQRMLGRVETADAVVDELAIR